MSWMGRLWGGEEASGAEVSYPVIGMGDREGRTAELFKLRLSNVHSGRCREGSVLKNRDVDLSLILRTHVKSQAWWLVMVLGIQRQAGP